MPVLRFIRSHPVFSLILGFGLVSLVYGMLVFRNSEWGDGYYAKIYVPMNKGLQPILEFSTAPMYMVLLAVLFLFVIGGILAIGGQPWKNTLYQILMLVGSGLIFLVSMFYWMWGYNYGRATISESYFQRDFIAVDTAEFKDRWALQTNRVNTLRSRVVMPESGENMAAEYTRLFRKSPEKMSTFFGLDSGLQPRCKEFIPPGFLLRLNTAGFYFPLGIESYVDKALHVSQKPAVIAHELAHGYGVTDEGEANFVGYLLCQASGDPLAQYSSALMLWLYMAADGRRLDPQFSQAMWDNLSPQVWIDLDERRKLDDRYPEFMPRMRDAIYDSYLSMNRVEGGLKSYSRFVTMILTYEQHK